MTGRATKTWDTEAVGQSMGENQDSCVGETEYRRLEL
jgi:hypothetical protein